MFTGIVVERGNVERAKRRNGLLRLEVAAPRVARELKTGDSVAVNGVCLTAVDVHRRRFAAEAMGETLERSTLGALSKGSLVNVELPARLIDRLGGHMVQGHVDGTAAVTRIEDSDGARHIWFAVDDDLLRYMVHKGSVTLDGVALTIAEVGRTGFRVALIPHTRDVTTLEKLKVGSHVNVEVDVIAKYVERFVNADRE